MPDRRPKAQSHQPIEFLIPLSARRAATEDEGGGDWLPILPVGRWASHHFMGEGIYEITADNVAEIARNFADGIPPIRVAGNENHRRGPAVGWTEELRATAEGLEMRVKWTPAGEKLIAEKAFGYLSAEWYDIAWPFVDSKTGEKIAWVFTGWALTNNPFFTELPAVAEQRQDGVIVYAAGSSDSPDAGGNSTERGDGQMRIKPNAGTQPPDGGNQDPPPSDGDLATQLADERTKRLAAEAEKTRLEAENAKRQRADDLAKVTARFAAVKTNGSQLAPAHATRLAEAAMEVDEGRREEHVTATIDAMTSGFVPAGEIGGASPAQVVSGGISPALVATARRIGLDPAFVYAAANRGPGGALDIEGARAGVGRIAPLTASIEVPSLSASA